MVRKGVESILRQNNTEEPEEFILALTKIEVREALKSIDRNKLQELDK
jgi:hypothetical protein